MQLNASINWNKLTWVISSYLVATKPYTQCSPNACPWSSVPARLTCPYLPAPLPPPHRYIHLLYNQIGLDSYSFYIILQNQIPCGLALKFNNTATPAQQDRDFRVFNHTGHFATSHIVFWGSKGSRSSPDGMCNWCLNLYMFHTVSPKVNPPTSAGAGPRSNNKEKFLL
jgi:hypothetical protein